MPEYSTDTIAAIATPPGRGGVGIIRVSGPRTTEIAKAILGFLPKPRLACFCPFYESLNKSAKPKKIDEGIALFFPCPHSFTGEDVMEFQGHGGPVILDILVQRILALGARLARPGEFSERAFLNDKLDLVQAEAIADLIEATSEQAARSALRSLEGVFSGLIEELVELLIQLRIYVEAAIDFPEEDIDFLSEGKVLGDIELILGKADEVFRSARQGSLIREGMTVVIAGPPNAGKSSLLNALAGKESAIVTDVEGTTRDVLREQIHIDGMPLHIVDTAGLRVSGDVVERIGIARAWQEIDHADRILFLIDSTTTAATQAETIWPEFYQRLSRHQHITLVRNKVDLSGEPVGIENRQHPVVRLSAKNNCGIDVLRKHLKQSVGFEASAESGFLARRRHLDAINKGRQHIVQAKQQLLLGAGELVAEELKLAQNHFSEITGAFSSDDLLGRIFSGFCIGK